MTYWNNSQGEKVQFHKSAKKLLRSLAKHMHLDPGHYDVRSNKGGAAVLGEVTLHTDKFYVQAGGLMENVLYRSCNGLNDYCGGPNHFVSIETLKDAQKMSDAIRKVL